MTEEVRKTLKEHDWSAGTVIETFARFPDVVRSASGAYIERDVFEAWLAFGLIELDHADSFGKYYRLSSEAIAALPQGAGKTSA
ncbi:MAG: hypothetical protein JWP88_825 [Flaviaesturariibacter sp.]|nr:hypothetical protein [Flaviaesturariibacter sp.]